MSGVRSDVARTTRNEDFCHSPKLYDGLGGHMTNLKLDLDGTVAVLTFAGAEFVGADHADAVGVLRG